MAMRSFDIAAANFLFHLLTGLTGWPSLPLGNAAVDAKMKSSH